MQRGCDSTAGWVSLQDPPGWCPCLVFEKLRAKKSQPLSEKAHGKPGAAPGPAGALPCLLFVSIFSISDHSSGTSATLTPPAVVNLLLDIVLASSRGQSCKI